MDKLQVTKENVFRVATEALASGIRPSAAIVGQQFDQPSSGKLKVWLAEWKEENLPSLAPDKSVKFWKDLAVQREQAIMQLQNEINELKHHLNPQA